MKARSLTNKLVFKSICLFLSFFVLFSVSIPANKIMAQTYDIVVETEMNEITVKLLEINYSENIVHFYKFDSNGNPVYDEEEQVTFTPGDELFEYNIGRLTGALIANELTIQSNQEFSFQIYYGNLSDWEMVLQICYDGDSDYRSYEHHELDDPFDVNSVIGDFSILFVGEETYTGYKYTVDQLNEEWDRMNTQGNNSESTFADTSNSKNNHRTRFKIEGTTSKGRKIKIEDKGDGKGPQVYEDLNNDGDFDDEGEHITDPDEIEEIMDEVTDDLENGLGDYEGEAWDDNGTPDDTSDDIRTDAIIWIKNKDGTTYSGIKIEYNEGTEDWDLDGANKVTQQWMADHGYIPHGTDPNPKGAWFVGRKQGNYFSFEKFYNNQPYSFGVATSETIIPYDPENPGRICFVISIVNVWP